MFMGYPIISDEYNIISEGLFLYDNSSVVNAFYTLPNKNYYGFGYAIIFGFLGYFINNMHFLYIAVLCVNAFFLSFIPVIGYKVCREFNICSKYSFIISLTIVTYPAYFVYAKYTLNETFLTFLLWCTAYCFICLLRSKTLKKEFTYSFLIGVLSMYAYTVHGRGLAILGMSFLLLVILLFTEIKNKLMSLTGFLMSSMVLYYISRMLKDYIAEKFLGTSVSSMANTAENFLSISFFKMLFGENAKEILVGFFGQSFYIICSTLGLAAVAVVFYFIVLFNFFKKKDIQNKELAVFATFVVGTTAATLIISTLFFSNLYVTHGMVRGEYWIYGRYNELCLGLLVFFALLCIVKYGINKLQLVSSVTIGSSILLLGYRFVVPRILELENPDLSYTMVPGLIPFAGRKIFENPSTKEYVSLIIIIVSIFILLLYCGYTKKKLLIFLMTSICFVYSIVYSMCIFVRPASQDKWEGVQKLEVIGNDERFSSIVSNIYVLEMNVPIVRIPFAFPQNEVIYLDSQNMGYMELQDIEDNSLILSTNTENLDLLFSDVYYIGTFGDCYVWSYGKKLISYFKEMGMNPQSGISENEKIPVRKAYLYTPQNRIFKMSDLYKKFRYNVTSDDKSVLTANRAVISSNGYVSLNNLYIGKGEMSITFKGSNIENSDIIFKNVDSLIKEINLNESEITYIIDVKEESNNFVVQIRNNSETIIDFDEMSIETVIAP